MKKRTVRKAGPKLPRGLKMPEPDPQAETAAKAVVERRLVEVKS